MSMAVIGVAGVVVGAGAGIYSATQAGKGSGQQRSTQEIGQMPLNDYQRQLKALSGQQFQNNALQASQSLALYPEIAAQEREQQRQAAEQQLALYPRYAAAERAATTKQRRNDLGDYGRYGQGFRDQFSNLSTGYAGLDGVVNEATHPSGLLYNLEDKALNIGNSELRDALQASALDELRLGRTLSPEQERMASQSARGAASARGTLYSTPSSAAEILQRAQYADQLYGQRVAGATQAWQTGATEDQNNRAFAMGVGGLLSNDRASRAGTILGAGQAQLSPIMASLSGRTNVNPYGLLGSMAAPGVGTTTQLYAGAPQVTGAANAIQPLYGYGSDVYGTNYNAAESRANAQANAYASIGSGLASAGGSLYAASARGGSAPAVGSVNKYGGTYEGLYAGKPLYAASRA